MMNISQSNDRATAVKKRITRLLDKTKELVRKKENVSFENAIQDQLPESQKKGVFLKIQESRERNKKRGTILKNNNGLYVGDDGRDYADIDKMVDFMDKEKDEIAMKIHNNDPNKRLDLYGFPTDRKDRLFILNHDFGHYLKEILKMMETSWIFLHGDQGRGKTALATRVIWELIKNHPSWKADFISINALTQAKNDEEAQVDITKLKRFILIDDFDTFDFDKEYRIRQVLRLIENIKNRHKVIFTSNRSLVEMSRASNHQKFNVMLDRIKGRCVVFPRFSGVSYR